jgi:aminoacyl tRNA synthase complex-interacting multifunctional protein 1
MSAKPALEQLEELIGEIEGALGSAKIAEPELQPGKSGSKGKADKKASAAKSKPVTDKPPKAEAVTDADLNVNSLDLRVGVIKAVKKHDTADKLYCEEIDVGESEPRAIASGLVPHYTLNEMENRSLIVICNLKPRSLQGFKSNGMVLCAAKEGEDGSEKVELLEPPPGAKPGDRVTGTNLTNEPVSASQCDKKKVFEKVSKDLRVNADGVAEWQGIPLLVASCEGKCTVPTIRDGSLR